MRLFIKKLINVEKIKFIIIEVLYKIVNVLYFIINLLIPKVPKSMVVRNIGADFIYPYDLVTTCEDYQKMIEKKYKEEEIYHPIFGIVIAVDKYVEENGITRPEVVKVCYFNFCNFKIPVIKTYKVDDLIFLLSPIKEFTRLASLAKEMEDILADVENALIENIDPEDDGGEGPLVH